MTGVFRLRGSDVYRVESVSEVYGTALEAAPAPEVDVTTLRACMARLSAASDLASLIDALLDVLQDPIGVSHAMVLMYDPVGERLYTVASRGYAESGVGAELHLGEGLIGTAAQARIPIRISHATSEFGYGRAMREDAESRGVTDGLEERIPFPGLPESQSQIAVPILAGPRLLGVLFAESEATGRFGYDEEDGFTVLASHVGAVASLLEEEPAAVAPEDAPSKAASGTAQGPPLRVRRYVENDSIFVGEDYLIKGVAGAILWRLLRAHLEDGRSEHTNRELRLDPAIRLPDLSENLEARLILLQRRLEERCPDLQIEKTGRGRFRFNVRGPCSSSRSRADRALSAPRPGSGPPAARTRSTASSPCRPGRRRRAPARRPRRGCGRRRRWPSGPASVIFAQVEPRHRRQPLLACVHEPLCLAHPVDHEPQVRRDTSCPTAPGSRPARR